MDYFTVSTVSFHTHPSHTWYGESTFLLRLHAVSAVPAQTPTAVIAIFLNLDAMFSQAPHQLLNCVRKCSYVDAAAAVVVVRSFLYPGGE